MENIAVFVNDVAHARHILQPMLSGAGPTRWILVACPPTLTRHIGRWVSHSARRQWRERWAAELLAGIEPVLRARAGSEVQTSVASKPLVALSARLSAHWPQLRLLDARRPRVGATEEPISADQPVATGNRWAAPTTAAAGLSLVLTLAD